MGNQKDFEVVNGCIVLSNGVLKGCHSRDEKVVVPEGVKGIAKYAFLNSSSTMSSISLPDSVTDIYEYAWEAMQYLDEVGQLDTYADLRGMSAEAVRDRKLSDIGLDEQGGKEFDLGNQTITVRLQKDFSYLVELSNGTTAKKSPKRGQIR